MTSKPPPPSRAKPPILGQLRALWARETWLATASVVVGLPMAVITFAVFVALIALTAGLAVLIVSIPVMLAVAFACSRGFTRWHRARFAAFLDVQLPAFDARSTAPTVWGRVRDDAAQGSTWLKILYHFLVNPVVSLATFIVVVTFWAAGLTYGTFFAHAWRLEPYGMFHWRMQDPRVVAGFTVVGLLILLAAPWIARGAATLQLAIAKAMLGSGSRAELARRVDSLTESRAGLVNAADAERRRIERDLHDGAQQRLVSLAMNLGISRAELTDMPEPARRAIKAAHEEAKQALVEMRDFVRGLYPAVLNDRGLDAALSGIAARSPVPVRLRVEVEQRPSPTIEAIAYFVVSEALTNIAKHAHASQANVSITREGSWLRVIVSDDGRGGAHPDHGSGLRGLAQRVGAVDGTLHLDSPAGGPTTLTVELPCES